MAKYRRTADTYDATQWRRLGDLPGDRPFLANGDGKIVKAYQREGVRGADPCIHCRGLMSTHGWIDPPEAPGDPLRAGQAVNPVTGELLAPPPPVWPKVYMKGDLPVRVVETQNEEQQAVAEGYELKQTAADLPRVPERAHEPALSDAAPAYPATFCKEGEIDQTVHSAAEEKKARAKGYTLASTEPKAADARAQREMDPRLSGNDPRLAGKYNRIDPNPSKTGFAGFDPNRGDLEGLPVCPGDYVIKNDRTGEYMTRKPDQFPLEFTKV